MLRQRLNASGSAYGGHNFLAMSVAHAPMLLSPMLCLVDAPLLLSSISGLADHPDAVVSCRDDGGQVVYWCKGGDQLTADMILWTF